MLRSFLLNGNWFTGKKSYKKTTQIGFLVRKKYLPIQFNFPFLFDFFVWMSFLRKRTLLRGSFDLKHLNNLTCFYPLPVFDINLKLIAGITFIYIKLRYTGHGNLSVKVERHVLKKIPLYKIIRDVSKFSLKKQCINCIKGELPK